MSIVHWRSYLLTLSCLLSKRFSAMLLSLTSIVVLSVLPISASAGGACVATQDQSMQTCQTLYAGQTIAAGTVCAKVVGDQLSVTYTTTNGWTLSDTHLWAGSSLTLIPANKSGNPQIGLFPYKSGVLANGSTTYTVNIPLVDLGFVCPKPDAAYYIAAHAVVKKLNADGSYQTETGWASGTSFVQKGSWATYFSIMLSCNCTVTPPPEATCETAFAKSQALSTCFIGSGLIDTNRWGWTNGPIGSGTYMFDIYAGAGQCDVNKGWKVGQMTVVYDGSSATATYNMEQGFTLDETHFYIGSDPLPSQNGEYTVAPGQFGNIHDLTNATSDEFTISGLSGNVYVVAHGVVCSVDWPSK